MTPAPLRALLIDDSEDDSLLVLHALSEGGFQIFHKRVDNAKDMGLALDNENWDVVISDYSMPSFSGLEALALFKERKMDIPFFLVSGTVGEEIAVTAMKSGAHDYIMKHNLTRLCPAVKRELQETEMRKNRNEMELQLKQATEHLTRLKRFFSPQIAELMSSGQMDDPFKWHRKDVTVLFMDLHGFTDFVEVSEPEVVINILQEYYSEIGKIVQKYVATVGHVAGDGVMVFLNDPIDIPNPQEKGVQMALELRELMKRLMDRWDQLEYPLDFGAGLASGYATIGGVGADGCWDYSIFGTVTNTASRLCNYATNGQILISKRFLSSVESIFDVESMSELSIKGLKKPIRTFNVLGRKSQPAPQTT